MTTAVLTRPGAFDLRRAPVPLILDDQVRVKVEGCGICASSLPLWEGREWFTYPVDPGSPGHEGWGTVDAVGEKVTSVKAGDRIAFLSEHSYAEYDVANEDKIVVLPDILAGKPFPGEPLGCAMNIFERSKITKDDIVAIIGVGFLGALLCQLVRSKGAKVIAISRRAYSLEIAKNYGVDEAVPLNQTWEVASSVSEITSGNLCSCVIEATGTQAGIDVATEIVAEGGRLIIAGYHQDGLRQVNLQKWNWKGIDVINAHERKPERYILGIRNAIDAVVNRVIDPEPLYTHRFSLNQISQGFEATNTRPDGFMKALIEF